MTSRRTLIILITAALIMGGGALFLKTTALGANFLWNISNQGQWLLPLILVSSLLDSINPCAFSVLLLTIAFLLSIGKSRGDLLRIGSAYIVGIFIAYLLIGLGILQALHLFNTPHFVGWIGAWLLIGMGVVTLINEFMPAFPIKPRIPNAVHRPMATLMGAASLPAAVALGMLVGLCEFPCTGGPYLSAIGLLHDQATRLVGFGYLVLYNLIFVLPLVVVLFIAGNHVVLNRLQQWRTTNIKSLRFWSGIAMIALGVFILNF